MTNTPKENNINIEDIEKKFLESGEEINIMSRELNDNGNEEIRINCGNNLITLIAKGIKEIGDKNYLYTLVDGEEVYLDEKSQIRKEIKLVYLQKELNSEVAILSTLRNAIYMGKHLEDGKKAVEEILQAS